MQQLFEPVRELWLEIKLITESQISIIITQTIIIPILTTCTWYMHAAYMCVHAYYRFTS